MTTVETSHRLDVSLPRASFVGCNVHVLQAPGSVGGVAGH